MESRLVLCLWLGSCAVGAAADGGLCKSEIAELKHRYVRPTGVPFPSDNSFTREREQLGRALFFDPRLSASGTISCASCHNPAFGWDDGLRHSIGEGGKESSRKTPSIVNVAWGQLFFWDGRAGSLEEQALGPIQSGNEMNFPLDKMVEAVRRIGGYAPLFDAAYPGEPMGSATVAKAIATFERTIVSGRAPFDGWIEGDERAISEPAQRGFVLFNGKAGCAKCHSGWEFTDHGFHDIGTVDLDLGRGKYLQGEKMQHAFKTPGLRNVARRAAFMHDGSERTLPGVIEYYDGGGMCLRPSLAAEIHPLHLTAEEKQDLLSFLVSLTSEDAKVEIPTLPGSRNVADSMRATTSSSQVSRR